ncbi:hypothetical protein [Ornithinibacillus californiensis]|uniref:hypothetical protein n=1 Tax=Ornithinibacillus californiensis TaxID=161536 RepID=UPI00064D8798|nr:hypothetical protein [Ornithinibacillus californiensis]
MLVQSVITIAAILAVVGIILGFVFLKASGGKGFLPYYPMVILGIAGIVLACVSAPLNVHIMDVGLGGWGIACLFAAMISFLVTSISHAYQVHDQKA